MQCPQDQVPGPVAHVVRGLALTPPARRARAVTRPEPAMVVEARVGDDLRLPAEHVRFELVDPVPTDTFLERQDRLEALLPVRTRSEARRVGKEWRSARMR